MLAVAHRAELRSRALAAGARILAAIAVAVGMVAVAGRVEDLNLSLFEAIALVLDIEIDNLAVILAIALGGVAGEEVAGALTLARYEREHGGTVYRIEDPVGTEAGLAWLAGRGE